MSGNERSCILNRVQQAGFAVDEVVLYLDTHPCDSKALAFYQKARDEQKRAVCEYNAKIGPLTNDMVEPIAPGRGKRRRTTKCGIMKNACSFL
mgnify:CR=1 FL=1